MKKVIPVVRFRVVATIDVEALDFVEAAGHQKRIEECLAAIRTAYPEIDVQVRERRPARDGDIRQRPFHAKSGRLNAYD